MLGLVSGASVSHSTAASSCSSTSSFVLCSSSSSCSSSLRLKWLLGSGGSPTRRRYATRTRAHTLFAVCQQSATRQSYCGAGGGGCYRVLQADLRQLQNHQAGSAEGDAPPHPLWGKTTPPESKMPAHSFQWSCSTSADGKKVLTSALMGPQNMRSSVTSHRASVTHMIELANQNNPEEGIRPTRQDAANRNELRCSRCAAW